MTYLLPATIATPAPRTCQRYVESPEYQAWLKTPAAWQSYLGQSMTGLVAGVRKSGVVAGVVVTATGVALQIRGDSWYEDMPVRDICDCTGCNRGYREWEMNEDSGLCLTCHQRQVDGGTIERVAVMPSVVTRQRAPLFSDKPVAPFTPEPIRFDFSRAGNEAVRFAGRETGDLITLTVVWTSPTKRGTPRWFAYGGGYKLVLYGEDIRGLKRAGYDVSDWHFTGKHSTSIDVYVSRSQYGGNWRIAEIVPMQKRGA